MTSHALIAASALVHGTTKYFCAHGVSSSAEQRSLQHDERDEKAEHRRDSTETSASGRSALLEPVRRPVPVARASGGFAAK